MSIIYTYRLIQAGELCHYILPSEKENGIKAYIFKSYSAQTPKEEFKCHTTSMVQTLFADRPSDYLQDVVFLQGCDAGKLFCSYSEEKQKLPMTLSAYLEMLKFFQSDYAKILTKIETDFVKMHAGADWLNLNPFLSFRGPADVLVKVLLDITPKYTLELVLCKSFLSGNVTLQLGYTDVKMGSMTLCGGTMKLLAHDLQTVITLVDYKESPATKRHRQC